MLSVQFTGSLKKVRMKDEKNKIIIITLLLLLLF